MRTAIAIILGLSGANAYSLSPTGRSLATPIRRCASPVLAIPDDEQVPSENKYSTDWDSAWQKEIVQRTEGNAAWRPQGREPVSEEQVQKARMQNAANDVQDKISGMVDPSDWKLWLAVLAVLSVGTALLGHTGGAEGAYSV